MLTDILATFAENPLMPAMWDHPPATPAPRPDAIRWVEGRNGVERIGHDSGGFAFDCETPRHEVLLRRHALADRLVTNGEWLRFMADGGYAAAAPWLSDGWEWAAATRHHAPPHWSRPRQSRDAIALNGPPPVQSPPPPL